MHLMYTSMYMYSIEFDFVYTYMYVGANTSYMLTYMLMNLQCICRTDLMHTTNVSGA